MGKAKSEESKVAEETKEAANAPVEEVKKESEVTQTVKKGKIIDAHIDSDPKTLLKWVQSGGSIAFDPDDLPKLSDENLEPFPYATVKAYKSAVSQAATKSTGRVEVLDTLGGNASTKLKLRKRRGYHQTWKRPDELDDALEIGYVVIREAKNDKERQNPGTESGRIKRIGPEDKAELIAMEVSQERYDNHVKAMTRKSRAAYTANKEKFAGNVEQFNRNLPKNDRMKVIDDEGDVG